jgi:SAM-dependent methyltransferase
MLNTTASLLRCPRKLKRGQPCAGEILLPHHKGNGKGPPPGSGHKKSLASGTYEISSGELSCKNCHATFPILAGVAIVVDDVLNYLVGHVKGISRLVPISEIPLEYRAEFLEAKSEIQIEHIEEDLEAQRVISLYLMNHYLQAKSESWWMPRSGETSPLIDSLVREHWDHGPIAQIGEWIGELSAKKNATSTIIELGCGVGGLYPILRNKNRTYLGVDSSFASIVLARHVSLGTPYPAKIGIPEDLLRGPTPRAIKLPQAAAFDGTGDFVVGDLDAPPLKLGHWDLTLVLNAIDMLDDPSSLPKLQYALLKPGGIAIQSGPYIWHEFVAKRLRASLPADLHGDSARAVEWLYEQAGFTIDKRLNHLPWLFFKHVRQLEIYSVHLLMGKKPKRV